MLHIGPVLGDDWVRVDCGLLQCALNGAIRGVAELSKQNRSDVHQRVRACDGRLRILVRTELIEAFTLLPQVAGQKADAPLCECELAFVHMSNRRTSVRREANHLYPLDISHQRRDITFRA